MLIFTFPSDQISISISKSKIKRISGKFSRSGCPQPQGFSRRVFTKVLAPLVSLAHLHGVNVFPYLDWLICSGNPDKLLSDTQFLVHLLQECGWIINWEKSHLVPTRELTFIGGLFKTSTGKVFLPLERRSGLTKALSSFMGQDQVSARQFLRLLGLMASCIEVVPYARLMMRPIQIYLLYHWRMSSKDLKAIVPVSDQLRSHLVWWQQERNLSQGMPIKTPQPQEILTTDASNLGFGGFLESGGQFQGRWSNQDLLENSHINHKELEAVIRCCLHFKNQIQGKHTLVKSDNATVVAYLQQYSNCGSEAQSKLNRVINQCSRLGVQGASS